MNNNNNNGFYDDKFEAVDYILWTGMWAYISCFVKEINPIFPLWLYWLAGSYYIEIFQSDSDFKKLKQNNLNILRSNKTHGL